MQLFCWRAVTEVVHQAQQKCCNLCKLLGHVNIEHLTCSGGPLVVCYHYTWLRMRLLPSFHFARSVARGWSSVDMHASPIVDREDFLRTTKKIVNFFEKKYTLAASIAPPMWNTGYAPAFCPALKSTCSNTTLCGWRGEGLTWDFIFS